ncbi:hypothetical protein MKX01_026426, partial [Papaver californicum]
TNTSEQENSDELEEDGNELREAEASLVTNVISQLIDMKLCMKRSFLNLYLGKRSWKPTLTTTTTIKQRCSKVEHGSCRAVGLCEVFKALLPAVSSNGQFFRSWRTHVPVSLQ